jgi:pyruvate dehydrogenase E1 component beta subunit
MLREQGVSAEVIDVRTVRPLDEDLIIESIHKTRHLVIVDTSWARYGVAAEVAAIAAEKAWGALRAPVARVTPPDCPAPVSKPLEDAFHPNPMTIAQACLQVLRSDSSLSAEVADVQAAFQGPY